MATGTVQFQSATLASPPAALSVMADAVNHSTLGAGSAQFIKIMDGAVGGTAGVDATEAFGLEVDVTRMPRPASNFGTRIAGTIGNLILLDANTSRVGAAFFHEAGGGALFLKLGSLAGTFDYTLQVPPNSYYEVPFGYSGTISGIWQTAGGSVQVTEVR